MAPKIKKSFWSKLTNLEETDLKQTGREIKLETIERKREPREKPKTPLTQGREQPWLPQVSEGKLSVDVCLDGKNVVVVSAIAGVKPADLEIIVDKDILTIKGDRRDERNIEKKNYLHQECFWGSFSRTILLPCEVGASEVKASLKNGILTVTLPIKESGEEIIKISPKTSARGGSATGGKVERKNLL